MSVEYKTKEDDVLDNICWNHYGVMDSAVEAVLEANPKLANYGDTLPENLTILLPDINIDNERDVVQLWS